MANIWNLGKFGKFRRQALNIITTGEHVKIRQYLVSHPVLYHPIRNEWQFPHFGPNPFVHVFRSKQNGPGNWILPKIGALILLMSLWYILSRIYSLESERAAKRCRWFPHQDGAAYVAQRVILPGLLTAYIPPHAYYWLRTIIVKQPGQQGNITILLRVRQTLALIVLTKYFKLF